MEITFRPASSLIRQTTATVISFDKHSSKSVRQGVSQLPCLLFKRNWCAEIRPSRTGSTVSSTQQNHISGSGETWLSLSSDLCTGYGVMWNSPDWIFIVCLRDQPGNSSRAAIQYQVLFFVIRNQQMQLLAVLSHF